MLHSWCRGQILRRGVYIWEATVAAEWGMVDGEIEKRQEGKHSPSTLMKAWRQPGMEVGPGSALCFLEELQLWKWSL